MLATPDQRLDPPRPSPRPRGRAGDRSSGVPRSASPVSRRASGSRSCFFAFAGARRHGLRPVPVGDLEPDHPRRDARPAGRDRDALLLARPTRRPGPLRPGRRPDQRPDLDRQRRHPLRGRCQRREPPCATSGGTTLAPTSTRSANAISGPRQRPTNPNPHRAAEPRRRATVRRHRSRCAARPKPLCGATEATVPRHRSHRAAPPKPPCRATEATVRHGGSWPANVGSGLPVRVIRVPSPHTRWVCRWLSTGATVPPRLKSPCLRD